MVHIKEMRLELVTVKAELERELATVSLNCPDCARDVHWMFGLGVEPGHWPHAEQPAPHHDPAVA